jgi:uncharacterized protein (TIGR03435 family)
MNVAAFFFLAALACAQPAFEVASIKQHPIKEGFVRRAQSSTLQCPPFHCGISGNRFSEEMASLTDLIMDAYNVRRYQIGNLPDWGDSGHDVYDINATVEGDRAPTLAQVRVMLQTLLADRFQLKLHRQTKELPVFALVVAKNGPKLKPCNEGGAAPDEMTTFHRSWERIAELLSMNAGRPVIDKTGLDGVYCTSDGQDPAMAVMTEIGNASRKASGGEGRATTPDESSLFTAVERKLGLKLEAQKAPVEILVIDHVERSAGN